MSDYQVNSIQHNLGTQTISVHFQAEDGGQIILANLPFAPPPDMRQDQVRGEALKVARQVLYDAAAGMFI